jgi:hypothetical protein
MYQIKLLNIIPKYIKLKDINYAVQVPQPEMFLKNLFLSLFLRHSN